MGVFGVGEVGVSGNGGPCGGGDGVWWPGEFEGGRFQGKWGRRWMSASV